MNKKLIGAAVAGAMAMPVAANAAEVSVFLNTNVGVSYQNNHGNEKKGTPGFSISDPSSSALSMQSHESNWGFEANSEVGDNMTLGAHVEVQTDLDQGSGSNLFENLRDVYLKLGTPFGTFKGGHLMLDFKRITDAYDPFLNTMRDVNAYHGTFDNGSNVWSTFEPNTIKWMSPKFNGLQGSLGVSLNRGNDELDISNDDQDHKTYEGTVSYWGNMFNASLNWTHMTDKNDDANANAFLAFAGIHVTDDLYTSIGAEWSELGINDPVTGNPTDTTDQRLVGSLSAEYDLPNSNNSIAASVRKAFDRNGAKDTGALGFALGVFHELSEMADVYVTGGLTINDESAGYGFGEDPQVLGAADETSWGVEGGIRAHFGADGHMGW